MKAPLKRIGVDFAGYFLILLGCLTGWLPGPGGIPLILAGLAVLSLYNDWAKRLREWLVSHGADFINNFLTKIFPKNSAIQLGYDIIAVGLLALVAYLVTVHAAFWQIGLASSLFVLDLLIVGMNRDRMSRLKVRFGRRKPATDQHKSV